MPLTEKKEKKGIGGFFASIRGFLSHLFYIISLVWGSSPPILILLALLCVVEGVLPVAGAYISKNLLDGIAFLLDVQPSASDFQEIFLVLKPIIFLLLLEFIYLVLLRVIERLNKGVTAIAGELVVNHIKLKIMNKAKTLDTSSFDKPEFYEKLENANREAGMRPISILSATFAVISSVISIVSFIVVLAVLSPIAPVIIIILALPGAIVNYIYRKKNYRYMRAHSKDRREMGYYSNLIVNKDYTKEIKIMGLGNKVVDKYEGAFKRYFKGLKNLVVRENAWRLLISFLVALAHCAVFGYVAYDVVFNGGMIGDYSLYTGALTSLTSYVSVVVTATAAIYEGTLFIDNMMDFMKEEPKIVSSIQPAREVKKGIPHTVELKNVSFSYPGSDVKVIDGVSLTLKSGETAVLVGLNGAGKTTLIKLITRLYDVTEGEILLDGYNIKEYNPDELYDLFGIIFQDFAKYAVTAAENIEFGDVKKEHSRDNVISAAENADAAEFIEKLPSGYETPLTRLFEESGVELSGGQWQKLSVARAFYKRSDILILDEPTASLDAVAEEKVFNRFAELSKGKISIFVSHRLSSAANADKIIVLNSGKLTEYGTHEELMSNNGEYAMLFKTQSSRYIK